MLEIGSGIGITSYFFSQHGIKCTLLDKSSNVKANVDQYWQKRKHNLIISNIQDYQVGKKYDIVSSFDLCKHFVGKGRSSILQKHIDLIKKDGITIISVPHKYMIFYRISIFLQKLI